MCIFIYTFIFKSIFCYVLFTYIFFVNFNSLTLNIWFRPVPSMSSEKNDQKSLTFTLTQSPRRLARPSC